MSSLGVLLLDLLGSNTLLLRSEPLEAIRSMSEQKRPRVTVDHEAFVELVNAINEAHDVHPNPHASEVRKLIEAKKRAWDSMKMIRSDVRE